MPKRHQPAIFTVLVNHRACSCCGGLGSILTCERCIQYGDEVVDWDEIDEEICQECLGEDATTYSHQFKCVDVDAAVGILKYRLAREFGYEEAPDEEDEPIQIDRSFWFVELGDETQRFECYLVQTK